MGHIAIFVFLSAPLIMLLKGKAFEGTFEYECTDGQLKLCTGASNTSCITRFRPVVFPDAQMVYNLLLALHRYHLCCFLTGAFALFVAGRLDSYDGIAVFVVMTDLTKTLILGWHFQTFQAPTAQIFQLDAELTFTLVHADDAQLGLYHYMVLYRNVHMPVSIFGIDTTKHCGPPLQH